MLRNFFESNPRAAVAFSGGVDSAYLLFCAARYAKSAKAYFVKTEFQPDFELEDAMSLARELKAEVDIIHLSALENPQIAENSPRRCYFCKKMIFSAIWQKAREDGFDLLLDGSNLDDKPSERPGMAALVELEVRSPLREAGLTKSDIRRLSREAGLFTHDKPSYSCLATRVPSGTSITREILDKTERGESALYRLGYSDLRLRYIDGAARLELKSEQLARAEKEKEKIFAALCGDYTSLVLAERR